MVTLNFARAERGCRWSHIYLFPLYTNSSTVALRNASLMVTLPADVFLVGQPQGERRPRRFPLGISRRVVPGNKILRFFRRPRRERLGGELDVILYDRCFPSASFPRRIQGVSLLGRDIELAVSAPANVFSGQNFTTQISYRNTTGQRVDGAQITMQYPQGFAFAEASPTPVFPGDTVWNIGTLAAGAGEISLLPEM